MAFDNSQSLTVSGTASTLPRTGMGDSKGRWNASDGTLELSVSSTYGKRTRRVARIQTSKIAPDPLISSTNIKHSMSAYVVVDTPVTGFTVTEQKAIVDALAAWLAAGTGAANHTVQLLGGEN